MIHPNPFISAFLNVPEWAWKNDLRRWLGFSKWVPNFIQDYSPLKGYERVHHIQPGDVVVDAGAYPGDYTLFAARQTGPDGMVVALEPDPENRKILEHHVQVSGCENVKVIPFGLWDRDTELDLHLNGVASTVLEGVPSSTVSVKPLDQLCRELSLERVDVLKMDIEGAELKALAGAKETLKDCRYVCVASYHVVDGEPTAERVEIQLGDAGFEVETGYPKHLTTTGVKS